MYRQGHQKFGAEIWLGVPSRTFEFKVADEVFDWLGAKCQSEEGAQKDLCGSATGTQKRV